MYQLIVTIIAYQKVLRHDFRASQLSDANKECSSRLSLALEEHKALALTWDLERYQKQLKKMIVVTFLSASVIKYCQILFINLILLVPLSDFFNFNF